MHVINACAIADLWIHLVFTDDLFINVLLCHPVGELEVKTREKLEASKKRTSQEITELKDKLKASRENINHLKTEIKRLEEDTDHKDH